MAQVSVVLPVYNIPSETMHQCIESILKQAYSDYEVILVDDGSDNGAERLCDEYAAKDSRFRVIHQTNKGVSAARNAGTAAAAGRWIIYLDPDDWWEPNTLEVVCGYMEEKELDVLVFSYFDEYPDRQREQKLWRTPQPVYIQPDREILDNMQIGLLDQDVRRLPGYFGAVWIEMFRLDFLREKKLCFNETLHRSEDAEFNLLLLDAADRIGILDIPLYHYRHHAVSACNHYNPAIEEIMAVLGKEIYRFCERKPEAYMQAYRIFMVKNYLAILRIKFFHSDNPDPEKKRKKEWKDFIRNHSGFIKVESTSMKALYRRRKITAILFFLSFKIKSYFLVKLVYHAYHRVKALTDY